MRMQTLLLQRLILYFDRPFHFDNNQIICLSLIIKAEQNQTK